MSTSEDIIKVLGVSASDSKTTFNISNKSGKTISVLVGMTGNDPSYYSGTDVENTLKFEELNKNEWKEIGVGRYVKKDRFLCKEKPESVTIRIKREYCIEL